MLSGDESFRGALSGRMARPDIDPHSPEAQAARLKRLRKYLGYDSAKAFALQALKLESSQRYSPYENGKFLTRDMAFKVKEAAPGITTDWLFYGDVSGLTLELARRLGELDEPPGKNSTSP